MENLKQRTVKAFAWDMTGKLADQGIGFFISIILARLLAPEEFGLLAMASVIIALAQILIDSGLGTALVQRQVVRDDHYGSVFCFNMVVGSTLTLIFFLTAGLVAGFYNRPELKPIIQALSFSFIINSFARVQSAYLTKRLNFGIITRARIISLIISGGLGVTLAFLNYGVWALVIQSLLGGILTNAYISVFAKWKPKLMFRWQALKELWHFGFRMFLSGIINTITSQIDNLIVGKIFSAQTLGFYQRAKSFDQFIIRYTSGSIMPVLLPALSNIQDQKERYNQIVIKSFHILSFVTFFIVGFLFLVANDVIVLLFSAKWAPSVVYFKILIVGGFVYPLSSLLVSILTSKGNSRAFLRLEILKQSMMGLALVFGFWFGLNGFLYCILVVYYLGLALNIKFATKEMDISSLPFFRIVGQYLMLTGTIILTLLFVNHYLKISHLFLHLVVFGSFFTLFYLLCAYLFRFLGLSYILNEMQGLRTHLPWIKK